MDMGLIGERSVMVESIVALLKNRFSYYLKRGIGKNKILKRYQDRIDSSNSYTIGYESGYSAALVDIGADTLESLDSYLKEKYLDKLTIDHCIAILDHPAAKQANFYVISNKTYYSYDKGYFDENLSTWINIQMDETKLKDCFTSIVLLSELNVLVERSKNNQIN